MPRLSCAQKACSQGQQMKAIYVRTSTDDNDGAAQIHELRKWCNAQGWQNVKEYIEQGEHGDKDSRPEWDKLKRDVRSGKVTEIVATQLSRLGRSVINVILSLDEFYQSNCRVVLIREGLDYATPVGRAVAAILAAVAQLELEQIRERIRSGVRRAKEVGTRSGKPIGRPRQMVTEGWLKDVQRARSMGTSWAKLAKEWCKPPTTLKRLLGAYQNPTAKNGTATT
jgi:DNA invertase Pin-like site-specific DNA recombinase